jgi:phosphomannomutase
VAVDCVNGACSAYSPRLLEALGCRVVAINDEPDLPFPHPPQPTTENLGQLRALVRAAGADVGFAHDADGDRLGVVCENGNSPGEEATLGLCAEMILRRGDPGPVVTNLSTSMAIEEIAARYGRTVHRTGVGQAYITEAALNYGAALAGEGSGGIVFPRLNFAHDSLAAMAHILDLMAQVDTTLCEFVAGHLPHYVMAKAEVACPAEKSYSVLQSVREGPLPAWAQAQNLEDGLLLRGADRWVHVRVSQTEPTVRVIAESKDEGTTAELLREYVTKVRRAVCGPYPGARGRAPPLP